METKNNDTCFACSCPCKEHTVHTHGHEHEHEHGHDHSHDAAKKGVCLACAGDKNAEHTCG